MRCVSQWRISEGLEDREACGLRARYAFVSFWKLFSIFLADCCTAEVRDFTFGENALVFPAGVVNNYNELKTNGGRVLMVVGMADSLPEAAVIAQNAASSIKFDGKQYRKDIGYQSIVR